MSTTLERPEVGQRLQTVRRGIITRLVEHRADVVVTRTTKASVFAAYTPGGPEQRYVRRGDHWVLTPRYLSTTETLEPMEATP